MTGLAAPAGAELIGRRESQRHALNIAARLVAPDASLRVTLEDLSISGACLRLQHPRPLATAKLCWLGFEVFGRSVWNDGIRCGMVFEEPLSEACLAQSIEFGRLHEQDAGDKFARLASAWVHGPGDW